jgi:MATE family multidrug resistance protein
MIISISINVINIISSFILVKVFDMKVEGVAMGSVVSQYVGIVLSVLFFMKRFRYFLKYFNLKDILKRSGLLGFLNVSGDIFLRTLCIIVVFTFFTSKSAGASDLILAANSALLQFLFLFSYFLDGFAYAAEALIGKFTGRKNIPEFKRAVKLLFYWGGVFALFFIGIYAVGGTGLLRLFTNQSDVIEVATEYLPWLIILPLTGFSSFIWDGVYIGATASRLMRNTMLMATLVFFVLFYGFRSSLNNHALWLAMNCFMLGRGLFQTFLYKKLPVFKQ